MSDRDRRIAELLDLGVPQSALPYLLATCMADPIILGGGAIDLTRRITKTSTVIGSPAAAAETIVATTPAVDAQLGYSLALVFFNLAYTIGTNGTACTVQIRQTAALTGASKFTTGAQTGGHNTATQLVADDVMAWDTSPATQYTVSLQVTSGSAASTVSAVQGIAIYL